MHADGAPPAEPSIVLTPAVCASTWMTYVYVPRDMLTQVRTTLAPSAMLKRRARTARPDINRAWWPAAGHQVLVQLLHSQPKP